MRNGRRGIIIGGEEERVELGGGDNGSATSTALGSSSS